MAAAQHLQLAGAYIQQSNHVQRGVHTRTQHSDTLSLDPGEDSSEALEGEEGEHQEEPQRLIDQATDSG